MWIRSMWLLSDKFHICKLNNSKLDIFKLIVIKHSAQEFTISFVMFVFIFIIFWDIVQLY